MARIEESITDLVNVMQLTSDKLGESGAEESFTAKSSESQSERGERRIGGEGTVFAVLLRSISLKGKVVVIGRSGKNPAISSVVGKTVINKSVRMGLLDKEKVVISSKGSLMEG